MKIYKLLPIFSLLFLAACGDDTSSANNTDPENTSSSSEEVLENSSSSNSHKDVDRSSRSRRSDKVSSSSKEVASSSSAKTKNSSSSEATGLTDPLKIFKTRKPKAEVYTCKPPKGSEIDWTEKFDQQDWICSFKYDGNEGYVYVQSTPTNCEARFSMLPEMSVDTAAFYVNGKYKTLKDVTYNWGGNHHNDSFRFTYDGKVFEYNHSSYGWGYRSCQEMDCLMVYEADGETLIEDGCGAYEDDLNKSRTLPVVCRFANVEDGSFGDFTDSFQMCMGDFRILDPAE